MSNTPNINSPFDSTDIVSIDFLEVLKRKDIEVKYTSEVDVLVLSCAAHRIKNSTGTFYDITDDSLVKLLTDEDYELSTRIRKYYYDKLVMINLRGEHVSSFRKDLGVFLTTDGKKYDQSVSGIIYKLPEFYNYDKTLDLLKDKMFMMIDNHAMSIKGTVNLIPAAKLVRKARSRTSSQYWFAMEGSYYPLCIPIESNNPLLHIWDNIFNQRKVLKVDGSFRVNKEVGFNYYSASKWKLEG